ncbi:hypothetical protein CsSME_00024273 [Camellia sinensis var. sinensis]
MEVVIIVRVSQGLIMEMSRSARLGQTHLGLADLVDRSTGDLSQPRCDNHDYAMVDRAELEVP